MDTSEAKLGGYFLLPVFICIPDGHGDRALHCTREGPEACAHPAVISLALPCLLVSVTEEKGFFFTRKFIGNF